MCVRGAAGRGGGGLTHTHTNVEDPVVSVRVGWVMETAK